MGQDCLDAADAAGEHQSRAAAHQHCYIKEYGLHDSQQTRAVDPTEDYIAGHGHHADGGAGQGVETEHRGEQHIG